MKTRRVDIKARRERSRSQSEAAASSSSLMAFAFFKTFPVREPLKCQPGAGGPGSQELRSGAGGVPTP